jgi:ribosomal protein S14
MLFFKKQKAIKQQKTYFIKEVYYKLFKLFIIFLKSAKSLAGLVIQNQSPLYYRNICIASDKAKSITRKLKLSRIMIREISNKGLFFGLCKIS